ncbi:AGAP005807-PC-like protein [Anopheles sinensis]|uniref:AGAP005807-PC-like protein n=1 Tax=Anopheles sinensis TaxID=74873 RepID=A0A084WDG4_ANOSI|nr:AGAP005807-PC-like protein [Anopheles sinensis]
MRGDQKWPPEEYKRQSEVDNEERRKLAQQPAFRPRRQQKLVRALMRMLQGVHDGGARYSTLCTNVFYYHPAAITNATAPTVRYAR